MLNVTAHSQVELKKRKKDMGRYLTNGSLNRIFTRVKGYVDKLKTSGQVYDSARWGGKLLSEAVMRYSYAINTKGLDKTKFYPVVFGSNPWTFDCEIHTPGASGSAEFNQNYIHFMCNSYGWNDLFDNFKILTNGNYDDNEIVIGAIGAATENGQMCVWVRGGIEYDIVFWTNRYPTLYKGDAVCGTTTFTCGTNLDGGANVKTRILWKNDNTRNDAAYATKKEVSDSIDALNLNTQLAEKADKADVTSKLNGFSNALGTTSTKVSSLETQLNAATDDMNTLSSQTEMLRYSMPIVLVVPEDTTMDGSTTYDPRVFYQKGINEDYMSDIIVPFFNTLTSSITNETEFRNYHGLFANIKLVIDHSLFSEVYHICNVDLSSSGWRFVFTDMYGGGMLMEVNANNGKIRFSQS